LAIKIEMLRCFTMVAKHGSLSDAADALGRTPSAVSMMLRQFEDHIGAPLFETARKSRLTPVGTLIYEEARREVTHFENTVSVIEGLSRSEFGYLRLQIDIRDMDSAAIARELERETADIGIGSLAKLEGMTRTELFSDAFGVVCSVDHPIAQSGPELMLSDLSDVVLIANGLCGLITDEEFSPILANSRLMVLNTTSLMGLVRQGVGITVLPRLAVNEPQSGITFIPLRDVSARRTVHLVSQPKNRLMPAARKFLELVAEMTREGTLLPKPKIQES